MSFQFRIHQLLKFLLFLTFYVKATVLFAQADISIGEWRVHLSFGTINCIAVGDQKIYGATNNGIMVVDLTDNSVTSFSKLNGLTSADISYINYSSTKDQLVVSYADGNLDVIEKNQITNFNLLKNSATINGSKKINHISIQSGYAFLSADYGLVVFDLNKIEVKETWRDIGANGSKLKINASTFLGDSVFLSTEKGVLVGNINDNLLDYNNWKRFDQGNFSGSIQGIATFNNKIYSTINGKGVYNYVNGIWTQESFLSTANFTSLTSSTSALLIAEGSNAWQLDVNNVLTGISDTKITQPLFVKKDAQNNLWIGDSNNGLLSNKSGSFTSYVPNGPKSFSALRIKYFNNTIYSMPGGYSNSFTPLNNNRGFDVFNNGLWSNETSQAKDLTDISFLSNDKFYVSSFGFGVEERNEQGSVQLFDENKSTLVNSNPPGRFVNVTAIENSNDGLWVANYGNINSLHLLKTDNTWQSFSFAVTASRYPTDLLVDTNGYIWMVLNPSQGGGLLVFDKSSNKFRYLTDQPGQGGLPSKAVNAITLDKDGYVWVGTDSGVGYFIDSYSIFDGSVDAIKPIFESQYLLKREKITSISVDAGNRKWIGTLSGTWLFNSNGESQVYNFTEDNSPLLSNAIRDIEIQELSGEVFFATDKGTISFRGDATEVSPTDNIKIFPNPVTSSFAGTVGISGLSDNATVKITDISGRLLWETQANGGTATWNVRDYHGNRAGTGVYIVFSSSPDGAESAVGKIAVVE